MRDDRRKGGRHDGFALVAVLAVTALLSSLLLGLSLWSRNAVETAAVADSQVETEALLRSAATIAAYQLFVLKLPEAQVDGEQLALDAGSATVVVSDDSGKVDLNGSEPELLAAAYRASGLSAVAPDTFAARVADWRDANDAPSQGGAELPAYRAAGLPPPRNAPFRTLSDLQWVIGMDRSTVKTLAPFITVFNPAGRVNPFKSPRSLLRNLSGVDEARMAEIVPLLRLRNAETEAAIRASLAEQQQLLNFNAGPIFGLSISADLQGRKQTVVSTHMSPSNLKAGAYGTLNWRVVR